MKDHKKPREGALRKTGSNIFANPHDLLYSTVTMIADEVFKGGKWIKIYERTTDG